MVHLRKLVARISRNKAGFTLVELLVVVGIIVALAAVIIPNVARFAGKGEQGAQDAEEQNVNAAIDALMADKGLTTITSRVSPASSNADFSTLDFDPSATASATLGAYLKTSTTKYFYCWTAAGLVTQQNTAATACPP